MPFLNTDNARSIRSEKAILSQRARSSNQVLGSIQKYSSGRLRKLARQDFKSHPETPAIEKTWNDPAANLDWDMKITQARDVAEQSPHYLMERFLQRYVAEEVFARGIAAIEENRPIHETNLADPGPDIGGTLELHPALDIPT